MVDENVPFLPIKGFTATFKPDVGLSILYFNKAKK